MKRHAKASFAGSTQGSGMRRGRLGLVCLCALGLAAFLGSSAPSAGAQVCPNEAFRSGPSANLPDCRAYEMVSPLDMEGQSVATNAATAAPAPTASPDGNSVAWSALGGFGEGASSPGNSVYLSRRGANWSSENISPPVDPYPFLVLLGGQGFTEGLDKWVIEGGAEPPLTPAAAPGSTNLYARDNASGQFSLLSVGMPEGVLGIELFHASGMSADAGHVVFSYPRSGGFPIEVPIELTGCPHAPSHDGLCDWDAATGALSPVGVLPGGGLSTKAVSLAQANFRHPVSADGSRIFFHEEGGECGVCVRINGATTKLITEPGTFWVASSDGSLVYFTDGGDLIRYDVTTGGEENLTEGGGEVKGVLGASADGSRVYFVAGKELAPGATAGENNLYLWTEGAGFEFIATGNESSVFKANYSPSPLSEPNSRVTPDGMHVAFQANNSPTGFADNGTSQDYVYSAATGELVCASCVVAEPEDGSFIEGGSDFNIGRLSRNLSDDGSHLFFYTKEALVPQDTNGLDDVYEYDAASGQVGLISPGTGNCFYCSGNNEWFGDASPSGNDALFWTREQLVPVDQDEAIDVYDARVGGGLASQHPSSSPPCTGEACRSASSPVPSQPNAASAGFVGKGNVSEKQNCNKLGREAKKLSNRAKRLRKNGKQAKRNGKSAIARKRSKKATRLAKRARNKSKSAKKCRKRNRRASK